MQTVTLKANKKGPHADLRSHIIECKQCAGAILNHGGSCHLLCEKGWELTKKIVAQ